MGESNQESYGNHEEFAVDSALFGVVIDPCWSLGDDFPTFDVQSFSDLSLKKNDHLVSPAAFLLIEI